MAYSAAANAYANEVLEKRRQSSAMRTMETQDRIRSSVPGFTTAERERKTMGVLRMRARMSGDLEEAERLTKGITEQSIRIDNMLSQHGFSKKDLEEQHYCSECGDTGSLPDGSLCSCKEKLMAEYERSRINSISPLEMCTFDSFSLDKYSSVDSPVYGISPRINMGSVLRQCLEYADSFPNRRNLLFMGSAGLGKTHLALSIADRLIKKNIDVVYCSCSGTFDRIREEMSDYSHHSDTQERLKNCTLLILDDLGSEYTTNQVRALLYDILNSRLSSSLSTIITTNYTEKRQIDSVYGEKISSRIFGNFDYLPFFGDDIRLQD
ncbi:MAG: ATP-binding protein [Oscillospiraceae bacterium]|nr:ATP-binding protein [Oscillospiraceae bacterium]